MFVYGVNMSDNLKKKKPLDSKRVSLSQQWEIDYWCDKFNCTEEELDNAVANVGDSAREVEDYLDSENNNLEEDKDE